MTPYSGTELAIMLYSDNYHWSLYLCQQQQLHDCNPGAWLTITTVQDFAVTCSLFVTLHILSLHLAPNADFSAHNHQSYVSLKSRPGQIHLPLNQRVGKGPQDLDQACPTPGSNVSLDS